VSSDQSTDLPLAGVKQVVDLLNGYHETVAGPNLAYVDLAGPFGSTPTSIGSEYALGTHLLPHPTKARKL